MKEKSDHDKKEWTIQSSCGHTLRKFFNEFKKTLEMSYKIFDSSNTSSLF